MAWIDSKPLPFKLTSELATLLGLAAKRGYSNEALMALALDHNASQEGQKRKAEAYQYQLQRFGNYRPRKPLSKALAKAALVQQK